MTARGYWSLFRIRLINGLQYRYVAYGMIATRFLWSLMEVLAYTALYRGGYEMPMDYREVVSYLWMQQVLFALFSVVFSDGEISDAITGGGIAYELARPMGLYGRWFCQALANRLTPTVTSCLPALLFAFLMPAPYTMSLPGSLPRFLLFLASTALALGVVVALAMLMHISMFFTLSRRGIRIMVTAVTSFLSGGVVPLAFFPDAFRRVLYYSPFSAMQNTPLSLYAGSLSGGDALVSVALQAFWLTAIVLLGRACMRAALNRVVVQGG